jgi:hypothetical protein
MHGVRNRSRGLGCSLGVAECSHQLENSTLQDTSTRYVRPHSNLVSLHRARGLYLCQCFLTFCNEEIGKILVL